MFKSAVQIPKDAKEVYIKTYTNDKFTGQPRQIKRFGLLMKEENNKCLIHFYDQSQYQQPTWHSDEDVYFAPPKSQKS